MAKRKLQKFAELETFQNVLKYPGAEHHDNILLLRGNWSSAYFQNDNKITLELACGKADYTLALARQNPGHNFIGIDIKGDRLWKGAKIALEEGLKNVAFVRMQIGDLPKVFNKKEIHEIWITFPDPFPRTGKSKKRLTSPRFLEVYRQILMPKGTIHLKTDEDGLYNFTLEALNESGATILENVRDVYAQDNRNELLLIQTFYEKQYLEDGRTIKYLSFKL